MSQEFDRNWKHHKSQRSNHAGEDAGDNYGNQRDLNRLPPAYQRARSRSPIVYVRRHGTEMRVRGRGRGRAMPHQSRGRGITRTHENLFRSGNMSHDNERGRSPHTPRSRDRHSSHPGSIPKDDSSNTASGNSDLINQEPKVEVDEELSSSSSESEREASGMPIVPKAIDTFLKRVTGRGSIEAEVERVVPSLFTSLLEFGNMISDSDQFLLNEEISKLREKLKTMTSQKNVLSVELEQVKEDMKSLLRRHSMHVEESQSKLKSLETKLIEKEKLLTKKFDEITELHKKFDDRENAIIGVQKELEEYKASCSSYKTKTENNAEEAEELRNKIKSLKKQISIKDEKIKAEGKAKADLESKNSKFQENERDQQSKLVFLENQVKDLKNELAAKTKEMQEQRERMCEAMGLPQLQLQHTAPEEADVKVLKKRKPSNNNVSDESMAVVLHTPPEPETIMPSTALCLPEKISLQSTRKIVKIPSSQKVICVEAFPKISESRCVHPCQWCRALFTKVEDLNLHRKNCSKSWDNKRTYWKNIDHCEK